LTKVKELPVMKSLSDYSLRKEALKGAYEVTSSYDFDGIRGFLIIDDVFVSGSTLREICRTLNRVVPEIPRYVLTLTHLTKVWSAPR
jgi:predicted amidophosphoribosyltransferase